MEFHNTMTIVMWVGILPAGAVGALLSHLRLEFFIKTVAERFRWGAYPTFMVPNFDPRARPYFFAASLAPPSPLYVALNP